MSVFGGAEAAVTVTLVVGTVVLKLPTRNVMFGWATFLVTVVAI